MDLGAALGYGFLGLILFCLLGIGLFFFFRYCGGRLSKFMHEQTNSKSINWRINRARARVLRTQLRDFFNRSLARFDTNRLEESLYCSPDQTANKRPGLWKRVKSGIQSPFAAWKSACTETPKRENIPMTRRNLYTTEPVGTPIKSPPLPARNGTGANCPGKDSVLIDLDDNGYQTIDSPDSNTESISTPQTPDNNATAYESALDSTQLTQKKVKVSFNPNDFDSIVVLESDQVNVSVDSTSSVESSGTNVASNVSLTPTIAGQKIEEAEASMYRNLNILRNSPKQSWEESQVHQSPTENFFRSVFRNVQREQLKSALFSQLESDFDTTFGSSEPVPSIFLEQQMSVGSTMDVPESSVFPDLSADTTFESPGTPLANSSRNCSVNLSSDSNDENDVTIKEATAGQDTVGEQNNNQNFSPPAPVVVVPTTPPVAEQDTTGVQNNTYENVPLPPPIVPVRPAPAVPDVAAQPKKQRQKKVYTITSDYNLRSKKK